MEFTTSKDGIPRATVRIAFRVGVDTLHVAATEIVWAQLVNLEVASDVDDDAEEYAEVLTRPQIEQKARDILQASGYALDSISDDELWQVAYTAAQPVVEKFWPAEWAAHRAVAEAARAEVTA